MPHRSKRRRPLLQNQQRRLTLHYILFQAAAALAGGFIGAYLLQVGFSLSAALGAYAAYLAARSVLRFAALAVIRRTGYRVAFGLGTTIVALQFLPLIHAERPWCLAAWIGCVALGEAFYWPIYHATMAIQASQETRGRQVAARTTILIMLTIAGPLAGAALLTRAGPAASFGLATALTLLSVLPLRRLSIQAGPVPTWRETLHIGDPTALAAFAADGWLSAGLIIAWPMILFTAVGAHFTTLGALNAAAGLVGAIASQFCGRGIDRGHRATYLNSVCALLAAGLVLRAFASWSAVAASVANLTGGAVTALYAPVLMSVIYDRAKRSGEMFRFHFLMEAGWDVGAVTGCLAAAAVAYVWPASLAVLPAMVAIPIVYYCVRKEGKDFFFEKKKQKTFIPAVAE